MGVLKMRSQPPAMLVYSSTCRTVQEEVGYAHASHSTGTVCSRARGATSLHECTYVRQQCATVPVAW